MNLHAVNIKTDFNQNRFIKCSRYLMSRLQIWLFLEFLETLRVFNAPKTDNFTSRVVSAGSCALGGMFVEGTVGYFAPFIYVGSAIGLTVASIEKIHFRIGSMRFV